MHLRLSDGSERARWNAFAAATPVANVLQSYEWGELKGAFGWRPHRVWVERDGEPVAAASLLERRLPIRKSLFYCSRGPLLDYADAELVGEVTQCLREYCRSHNGFLLKIDPAVEVAEDSGAVETLTCAGFQQVADPGGFGGTQPRCVMKLDLTRSLDQVLAACKSKTRYNIRLAGRKGVVVRDDGDESDLKTFYALLQVTAERDGFLVRSYEYFAKLMALLQPAGLARLFMAHLGDEPLGGTLATRFGNTCCYLYGASANVHRNLMPNYLLQWRMIEWAHQLGCTVYDFRGVSPDPEGDDRLSGLNRFKSGFAPAFVEYVGEFDLPLSKPHYFLWTVARPAAVGLLKRVRRAAGQSPQIVRGDSGS